MQIYKFKKHFVGVVFSLITLLFCQGAWSEQVNILQGKPVFKLAIQGYGLRYYILVNGNSILNEYDSENQISTELPINQWMHPEQTTFGVMAFPQKGHLIKPGGYIRISLLIQDSENSEINYRLPILELNTSFIDKAEETSLSSAVGKYRLDIANKVSFGSGEIEMYKVSKIKYKPYEGAFEYSRKVTIPNSLPLWSFFNSDTLPEYRLSPENVVLADHSSLFVKYKKVQDALASGDIDSIMPMFAERNREGDLAFYYPTGTMESMLRTSMLDFSNNPDWKLRIRAEDEVAIIREPNEKLVSLFRAKQSNAIGFVNKKDGRYNSYPMKFRREDGKWILTR